MLSDACFDFPVGGDVPALIGECLHYAVAPFAYGDELAALLAAAPAAERDPGERSALVGLARLVMNFHDSPPDPRTEEKRRTGDLLRRELAVAASAGLAAPSASERTRWCAVRGLSDRPRTRRSSRMTRRRATWSR